MNLIDTLDVYSALHNSDNMFLLFTDYVLDERIDKNIMNTIIIKELGASKPITTDPDMFKILLDAFFSKYALNITKLVDTMYLEYNPLFNKDLVEGEHRHSTGDIDNTDSYTTGQSSEDKVSAYDASAYQPKDMSTASTTHNGETTSDIESTVQTDRYIKGKDGPESYQSLVEQERRLAEFNIFNWIIKQMRKELFLLVY